MSDETSEVAFSSLVGQAPAELRAQAVAGHESARKMRFQHAMSQLRGTHRLRAGRRAVARLLTAARQGEGRPEEGTR